MTYEEMLAEIRKLPLMVSEERIAQALDFAYGNLAASMNHKPTRLAFKAIAIGHGWTAERFEAWANTREWW